MRVSKENQDTAAEILTAVGQELLKRVQSGEATAAEIREALAYVRQCGVQDTSKQSPAHELARILPFPQAVDREVAS